MWGGLAGLLVSPSRGLLIYSPWVIFSLWGGAILWKENSKGWERYLLIGVIAIVVLHARLGTWWAGWSYGPRYLTDLLPFLAFFLLPVLPRIQTSSMLRMALVCAVAAAAWVQAIGASRYVPVGGWDEFPVSVDRDQSRLWDWTDNQILRTRRAGLAEPLLYYEWWSLFGAYERVGTDHPTLYLQSPSSKDQTTTIPPNPEAGKKPNR
jgi:hypothetical protein